MILRKKASHVVEMLARYRHYRDSGAALLPAITNAMSKRRLWRQRQKVRVLDVFDISNANGEPLDISIIGPYFTHLSQQSTSTGYFQWLMGLMRITLFARI